MFFLFFFPSQNRIVLFRRGEGFRYMTEEDTSAVEAQLLGTALMFSEQDSFSVLSAGLELDISYGSRVNDRSVPCSSRESSSCATDDFLCPNDRSVGRSVCWLAGRLIACLPCWSVGWLAG